MLIFTQNAKNARSDMNNAVQGGIFMVRDGAEDTSRL